MLHFACLCASSQLGLLKCGVCYSTLAVAQCICNMHVQHVCGARRMFGFADVNVGEGAPLQSSPGALIESLPAYQFPSPSVVPSASKEHCTCEGCQGTLALPCSGIATAVLHNSFFCNEFTIAHQLVEGGSGVIALMFAVSRQS